MISLIVLFTILSQGSVVQGIYHVTTEALLHLGFGGRAVLYMIKAYNYSLFGV